MFYNEISTYIFGVNVNFHYKIILQELSHNVEFSRKRGKERKLIFQKKKKKVILFFVAIFIHTKNGVIDSYLNGGALASFDMPETLKIKTSLAATL